MRVTTPRHPKRDSEAKEAEMTAWSGRTTARLGGTNEGGQGRNAVRPRCE
jgi:hypothetical protein